MRKIVIHIKDNTRMKVTKAYSNNVLKLTINKNGDNLKTLRVS